MTDEAREIGSESYRASTTRKPQKSAAEGYESFQESTTPDVREIAGKLSEAQKRWMLFEDHDSDGYVVVEGDDIWDSMAELKLSQYWTTDLTPLGLAVRAVLMEGRS